jgi:osmotically-inducible protein OsmY
MFKLQRSLKLLVCIGLVTALFGCQDKPKTETAGEKLDDTVMTTKVKASILAEPSLKSLQIDVITTKGSVRLSGAVDAAASVLKAGELARAVSGVTEVKNDLVVK